MTLLRSTAVLICVDIQSSAVSKRTPTALTFDDDFHYFERIVESKPSDPTSHLTQSACIGNAGGFQAAT